MELHQIQVAYQAAEDRILCRASFRAEDGSLQEVRSWLTRRMVKGLWPAMLEAMEQQVGLDNPQAAHASGHVVEMEHQASVAAIRDSGSFDAPYENDIRSFPLGEAPMLVTNASFSLAAGQPIRMNLSPGAGDGIEFALPQQVLYGFSSLLQDAVKTADWELELALPSGELAPMVSQALN
ncbi:hypothetical protein [Noviherbaspirillum sp.]|uniref:hypothetical protein n=1 Tax=Noviherbaspirillum sp. TaxID=1926288 RepID=UPI002D25F4CB|nr:hypothetical protein [Noviherbaspirillum sp.]HZW19654.1 hypothetical protein [Noviherbaspirillum sp.]